MKKQITAVLLAAAMAVTSLCGSGYFFKKNEVKAQAADTTGSTYDPVLTDDTDTVIVLDPGHGGSDPGTSGGGYNEKTLTLKIAKAAKKYLEEYAHVKVYMTRTSDKYVGLIDRTTYAANVGADAFVSIHLNANNSSAPNGSEIYYPNNHYDTDAYTVGKSLATNIQANLKALGLFDRQIKTKSSANGSRYPDGSLSDYYSVIRTSKLHHIPGIIVEAAFLTNPDDVANYLSDTESINEIGQADADGIAKTFNLIPKSEDTSVYPDPVTLTSAATVNGTNQVQVTWQPAANAAQYIVFRKTGANGTYKEVGRTTETSLIDGSASYGTNYYYTVIAKNNSGRSQSYNTAGLPVTTPRRDVTMVSAVDNGMNRVKVTWQREKGATGYRLYRSTNGGGYKKVTTIKKNASSYTDETVAKNTNYDYTVKAYFKTDKGNVWTTCVKKQATVTTDADPTVTLSGTMAPDNKSITFTWTKSADPDVIYRLYRKVDDGSYEKVNTDTKDPYVDTDLEPGTTYKYRVRFYRKALHSTKTYWSSYSNVLTFTTPEEVVPEENTGTTGTTENTANSDGSQSAQASVQTPAAKTAPGQVTFRSAYSSAYDTDQMDWVTPASDASLTIHWNTVKGADGYKVYQYNGKTYKRIATINDPSVNSYVVNGLDQRTAYTFKVKAWCYDNDGKTVLDGEASVKASGTTGYRIKGTSTVTAAQMTRYYNAQKKKYPSAAYSKYGAKDISSFTKIVYDESRKVGIRPEVLFAQICCETGFLQFGGDVKAAQCNFGGIGATGGVPGVDFVSYAKQNYKYLTDGTGKPYTSASAAAADAVRVGIRAQATHLALYASDDGTQPSVKTVNGTYIPDPRAYTSIIGKAPYVEWLGIYDNYHSTGEVAGEPTVKSGWAGTNNYGYTLISNYINPLLRS